MTAALRGLAPVLVGGAWRPAARPLGEFHAWNPDTGEALPGRFPVSGEDDLDAALRAAGAARLAAPPAEVRADFLARYADLVEEGGDALARIAHEETALPLDARLRGTELPRTVDQLRQAARAARARDWTLPTIDTARELRSMHGPLAGAALVLGPNNFPLAFNAVAGGDFAAAIAAGVPVLAKGHPAHPGTTLALARLAARAADETGLPPGFVGLVHHFPPELTPRLLAAPELAAVAFTGSRPAGLALKKLADAANVLFFAEMSSLNPVFVLPGALAERAGGVAEDFLASTALGAGQLCTNPGVLIVPEDARAFVDGLAARFAERAPAPLLDRAAPARLAERVAAFVGAGATRAVGGRPAAPGFRFEWTLLRATGAAFLADRAALSEEAFGPVNLVVTASGAERALIAAGLEGQLTASIYRAEGGADDAEARDLAARLRGRVGRLVHDRMPTNAPVSPGVQHGGPFPATAHPGFSALGFPHAVRRFSALHGYDHVPAEWLPPELHPDNPLGLWRHQDGEWRAPS